jgi:predicted secreted hydrolase
MNAQRRHWLAGAMLAALARPGSASGTDDDPVAPGRTLHFPRDHGSHPGSRIEWWYATGWLAADSGAPPADLAPLLGFQVTFFRSRTGLAADLASRFAPRQLLFAHAALTDLGARRHLAAQRIARWAGDDDRAAVHARREDTAVEIGPWSLRRQPDPGVDGRYLARVNAPEAGFALDLALATTQPRLLQGEAGYSRKGPLPAQASFYVSQPQLDVRGRVNLDGRGRSLAGRGWIDHEWSDELLAADAVGWDWIGINLDDGGALTAFRLIRRDGSVVWAGGSHRPRGGPVRVFAPGEVTFTPGREWTSPASGAHYPVQWRIETPAGRHRLDALLDAQELDSRASSGAIYWEGLAELRDPAGRRVGLGYLEMTGRAAPLSLG